MMMRRLWLGLALLAVSNTAGAQTVEQQFDTYVASAVKDWNVAGLAISVVKDGKIVFAKGYGVKEVGKPAAVDTQTVFAIASTTKAMTAAAIGMLVDEGRLGWDDPVTKHLPSFQLHDPYVTREVTVRDLLTHRAGLGNADYLWYVSDLPAKDMMGKLSLIKPDYSLRSSFIYQNVMYIAAGQVIEAVSGMPWEKFIQTRIFDPLGMKHSYPLARNVPESANAARPHWLFGDTIVAIKRDESQAIGPAGDVWSNVGDMSKWMLFLLDSARVNGKPLLKPETWAELFAPQVIVPEGEFYPSMELTKPHWKTYGLGWFQHDYQGRMLNFHTGSLAGMVAIIGLVPDERFGVYILANVDHAEVRHALMYRAIDTWLGNPARDWSGELRTLYRARRARGDSARAAADARRIKGTKPSLALAKYAGMYEEPLLGRIAVRFVNGALRIDAGRALQGSVEHWQYDTFRARYDDRWQGTDQITFTIGDGIPSALRFAGYTFTRLPDPPVASTH
jgi:CubicO group peptidase (beta-lactamase class C family)